MREMSRTEMANVTGGYLPYVLGGIALLGLIRNSVAAQSFLWNYAVPSLFNRFSSGNFNFGSQSGVTGGGRIVFDDSVPKFRRR
jgi:hypothetical protein